MGYIAVYWIAIRTLYKKCHRDNIFGSFECCRGRCSLVAVVDVSFRTIRPSPG